MPSLTSSSLFIVIPSAPNEQCAAMQAALNCKSIREQLSKIETLNGRTGNFLASHSTLGSLLESIFARGISM